MLSLHVEFIHSAAFGQQAGNFKECEIECLDVTSSSLITHTRTHTHAHTHTQHQWYFLRTLFSFLTLLFLSTTTNSSAQFISLMAVIYLFIYLFISHEERHNKNLLAVLVHAAFTRHHTYFLYQWAKYLQNNKQRGRIHRSILMKQVERRVDDFCVSDVLPALRTSTRL